MTDQRNIKDVIIKVFGEDLEKASRYHNSVEAPTGKQSSLAASPSTYQCLYLWLEGTGGFRVSYDFQSFPENYLCNFNDSSSVPPDPERPAENQLVEEVIPSSDDGGWCCLGMGCAKLGSKIFFVGGQKPQKMEDSASLALAPYSVHEYSSSVFVVDAATPSQQPHQVPSMKSGKASPLVLSVEESLYVLAGTPVNMLPNPAFEKYSYDNETSSWKWTNLPSPPFLDPSCKYFEDPQYCGYAVIERMIHVSTSSSSFYFNTDTETWERSTLFGDTPAEVIRYPPPFEWMNDPVDNDGGNDGGRVGGAPFKFNGEAVLYDDDVLICIVLSKGVVAAHYLVDGTVVRTQLLEGLKIPTDAVSACLVDFGHGLLCLVVSSFDPNQDLEIFETEISITSFRVTGNMNKELNCLVLEKRTMTQRSYFKIWSVTSCFVHNNSIAITSTRDDPSIPDMSSLNLLEQPSSSTFRISKESILIPVRRPDIGGRLAVWCPRLIVNHFLVRFNEKTVIIHYHIDIKPDVPSKFPAKESKSDLRMVKDKLFSDDPAQFPLSKIAYDGEKNIFSAVPLRTGTYKVDFSGGEDRKSRSYTVTIKAVNELEFNKLKEYLSGEVLSIPRDVLHGMDLIMKENPSRHKICVGRGFYSTAYNENDNLGGGITASKGFQQSLKPTSQGLALCLDHSVLAFHKRLPVIDFLMEHIRGFRGVNDVTRLRKEVKDALKGLKVTVTHRITKQKYVIAGLTNISTQNLSFDIVDPEGKAPSKQVSLVEYFRQKYGKEIKNKDIPSLDLGKNGRKNYVPMEFCILLEGQRYPKENLIRNGAMLLKNMSLVRPEVRMNTICKMVQAADGPCGGDVAQGFDIEVIKDMTKVKGRVIGPPQLKLRAPNGNITAVSVDRVKCHWNLVNKSVVEGKPVQSWALLNFSSSDVKYFVLQLIKRCNNLGIRMEEPLIYRHTSMRLFSDITKLRSLLEDVIKEATQKYKRQLQIIICVMAGKDPGYKTLKWLSETQIGILTQCCLSSHAIRAQDQYLANLALKINAKLGGSNVELIERLPRFEGEGHVMFVGADVNHPAARNSTCPSMAAVVATLNWPAANRYAARVCPQFHRTENILNFGTMCQELIQSYARINKVKPSRIVIFRDGVSEGQFDMVLNEELLDLKLAIYEEHYQPTITLVVAQKRHQTRLFPESRRDGSPDGNVVPGTIVDTVITHPYDFDFYLCSHYGSMGTSKPTHYYVLWDEHNFTSDQVQKLIYDLCFTFSRCTKPVSLVPPVYYADLVAYRGRMFQEVVMQLSPKLAAEYSQSVASKTQLPTWFDEKFYKLHPELENIMFFV